MRQASGASEPAAVREVVLYGRPGCHLCDEAREVLERIRVDLPFALVERDIERDDALFKAYLERIPVIALDGEELFDFFVDEAELRRRLAYTGQR
jgi:glutaredoxin